MRRRGWRRLRSLRWGGRYPKRSCHNSKKISKMGRWNLRVPGIWDFWRRWTFPSMMPGPIAENWDLTSEVLSRRKSSTSYRTTASKPSWRRSRRSKKNVPIEQSGSERESPSDAEGRDNWNKNLPPGSVCVLFCKKIFIKVERRTILYVKNKTCFGLRAFLLNYFHHEHLRIQKMSGATSLS